jgi:hypothetical protein
MDDLSLKNKDYIRINGFSQWVGLPPLGRTSDDE